MPTHPSVPTPIRPRASLRRPLVLLLALSAALAGCGGGRLGWSSDSDGDGTARPAATSPAPSATASPSAAPAGDGVVRIQVATDAAGVIRDDIGRITFGSGIEFSTPQLRWTMENLGGPSGQVSSKTRDAIRGLQLGTLRFPNGDSSFKYVVEDPQNSYPAVSGATVWNRYLTADDIVSYTAPDKLNMERLFEVNTAFWLDRSAWALRYLNDHQLAKPAKAPSLNTGHLDTAADRAADWVRRDKGQTLYWEVGNEDWSRWNGVQHAEIFAVFQKKMKAVRPDIQLLAQGLADDYNGNTPESWFNGLKAKLSAQGSLDSVYAYSVHQYLGAAPYKDDLPPVRRGKQTQDLLSEVAEGRQIEEVKRLLGTGTADAPTRKWKIWMTEYNVNQPSGQLDANGKPLYEPVQDMGHALVLADWTGKLLEQNVERVFVHSLDHNPQFALVQYANLGTDIENPKVTVPGQAFSVFSQAFGKTMLRHQTTGNPGLVAPNGKGYPQVSTYASLAADGSALRVVVINRHLSQSVKVSLGTQDTPSRRVPADGSFSLRRLSAGQLTDTNAPTERVMWSDTEHHPQTQLGTEVQTLAPASVNLFVVPLR